MRLAIVTCAKCKDLISSERALIPLLAKHKIIAEPVVWNDQQVDWTSFDSLLIRSIWDYHLYPNDFYSWLDSLANRQLATWNPIQVLRHNSHKFYLRDLEARGVRIIPTRFQKAGTIPDINSNGWKSVVVKPAISASAFRTETISTSDTKATEAAFRDAAAHGDYLVQEFVPAIQEQGELSMIFFNQMYSHSVLKRPGPGEFRVQKEFGGEVIPHNPKQSIVNAAENVLRSFGGETLYARVDGIVDRGEFVLMELELIEPDLFLDSDPEAHGRFVAGIAGRMI